MEESVTYPKLLDRPTAKAHLAALASSESNGSPSWHDAHGTERERIQALLDLVNSDSSEISSQRLAALRAFLEERVAVRERATLMSPRLEKEGAKYGVEGKQVPHRTVALSMAAETLPPLLNDHVHKVMHFSNAGVARTRKGRIPKTGELVSVVLEGAGGELAVSEYVSCDSHEAALNYALALVLAKNHGYGMNLCRCHAEGCGQFWLLPEKLTGKPSRNFCSRHEADKKRLSDAERKRRQRAQPITKRRR